MKDCFRAFGTMTTSEMKAADWKQERATDNSIWQKKMKIQTTYYLETLRIMRWKLE